MKTFLLLLFYSSFLYSDIYSIPLAESKKWLGLLHYEEGEDKSSILNKSFFLTSDGMINPAHELQETISRFENNDISIICKYPARYRWLSQKLSWKNEKTVLAQCKQYNSWTLMKNNDSLSVIFVSGFLGNPASAFGHSFFKLNQKNTINNLLDSTISYGAKLPDRYSMISYMFDGLFGGYTAEYSNKKYYMDDMAYTNKDFRDMWEYKLNLTVEEKEFFFMHLWELRNTEFKYYFFNRNCGYKVGELLDLVLEEDILDSAKVWYAPIETFYKLVQLKSRVASIKYLPSMQQSIYAQYKSLNKKEKNIVTEIIFNHISLVKSINISSRVKILDFVLNFYTYKMGIMDKKSNEYMEAKRIKQKYLFERMVLPAMNYKVLLPQNKRDITQNNKPVIFNISLLNNNSIIVGGTPFGIDDVGYNGYFGDRLSIFNIEFKVQKDKIDLHKFDIIKIRRLKIKELPFDIENSISWSLQVGGIKNKNIDYFGLFGLGYTWKINNKIKLYSMLNASIHTKLQRYRIAPSIGVFIDMNTSKLNIEYGKENIYTKKIKEDILDIHYQYTFYQNKAFYFNYEKKEVVNYQIGMKWYF